MVLLLVAVGGHPAVAGMDEARAALARNDYTAAVGALRPLAEAGDAEAETKLGNLTFGGLGVAQDDTAAVRWLRRAADQGYAPAEASLGALMMAGRGTAKDAAGAIALLKAAAHQGNPDAMLSLGHCAADGLGMPRSAVVAADWYRKAAEKGNGPAENALGVLLWSGADGVPVDHGQAVGWFKRAAAAGLGPAQYNLGKAYEAGIGIPQNLVEAYYWLSLAAAQSRPGDNWPAERDAVGARLSPPALAETQQRASRFRPMAAGSPPIAGSQMGSGFFINGEGIVLTNAHVVQGCSSVSLSGAAGTNLPAKLIAQDNGADLALLETKIHPTAVATFRDGPPIRPGDAVLVVGYPLSGMLSSQPIVSQGSVSALAGIKDDPRYLQVTAPLQQGNSGGPLFDLAGNVVGVVTSKLNALAIASATGDLPQNVNFAMKAAEARRLLDVNRLSYAASSSQQEGRPADVAERARAFVVAVTCHR